MSRITMFNKRQNVRKKSKDGSPGHRKTNRILSHRGMVGILYPRTVSRSGSRKSGSSMKLGY